MFPRGQELWHEMWKKRAETTWERGVVVKLINKTSSCIRPIDVKPERRGEGVGEAGRMRHFLSSANLRYVTIKCSRLFVKVF